MKTFESELTDVINRYSKENGSNTPDFILAEYLTACLEAFNSCSKAREKWYGKELRIGGHIYSDVPAHKAFVECKTLREILYTQDSYMTSGSWLSFEHKDGCNNFKVIYMGNEYLCNISPGFSVGLSWVLFQFLQKDYLDIELNSFEIRTGSGVLVPQHFPVVGQETYFITLKPGIGA